MSPFRVQLASNSRAPKLKKREKTSKKLNDLHARIKSSTFAAKIDDYETNFDDSGHFCGFGGSFILQFDADYYNASRVPKEWGLCTGNNHAYGGNV